MFGKVVTLLQVVLSALRLKALVPLLGVGLETADTCSFPILQLDEVELITKRSGSFVRIRVKAENSLLGSRAVGFSFHFSSGKGQETHHLASLGSPGPLRCPPLVQMIVQGFRDWSNCLDRLSDV